MRVTVSMYTKDYSLFLRISLERNWFEMKLNVEFKDEQLQRDINAGVIQTSIRVKVECLRDFNQQINQPFHFLSVMRKSIANIFLSNHELCQ